MAGNYQAQMPVMAMNQIPNQQQMVSQIQQQDQSQMSQMQMQIYHHIQEQTSPILTGWQNSVMLAERYGHVSQMITQLRLSMTGHPGQNDMNQMLVIGLQFEKDAFDTSSDKIAYTNTIRSKLHEMQRERMNNRAPAQKAINQQHAQQMQAQQLQANMLQNGMQRQQSGQQGFQHLQHQMQASALNPQHQQQSQQLQQMPPSMNGTPQPNGQAMNQFHMMQQQRHLQQQQQQQQGGGARVQPPQFTQNELTKINAMAMQKLQSTSEQDKQSIRMSIQNKFPLVIQQAQQSGMDMAFIYFRNQIKGSLQQEKLRLAAAQQQQQQQQGQNSTGPSSVPMQPTRSGNPNSQQSASDTFFGNADLIGQQAQAGIIAQAQGQVVVPATSNNPPRINTPQGHGGMPGQQNPANNPRQTSQAQQFFNAQQAAQGQRVNLTTPQSQQQVAASAAQNRARNEAVKMQQQRSLQGQLGGLGEMPPQQSPAMKTLNTPLRPPGQQPVPPENPQQMGQTNELFVGLDPRFNQQNVPMQRPGGLGAPMNPVLHFPANMPPETRHQVKNLPAEEAMKFMKHWQESHGGPMLGMPMNGQGMTRPGQPMPQNMGFVAQAIGNQPNGAGPSNMPPGMDQQQFQARMAQMQQQQRQGIPTNFLAKMDSMQFPRQVLRMNDMPQQVPQDIQNWAQLKQFVVTNSMPPQIMEALKNMQLMHYKQLIQNRNSVGPPQSHNGQQLPTGQIIPPGMQAPIAPMAPMMQQQPPNQIGNMGIARPTDQEVQSARQRLTANGNQHINTWNDEQLRMMLMRSKAQSQQQQHQQQQRMVAQMQQNPQIHQQQLQQANQLSGAQRGAAVFQPTQTRPGSNQPGISQPPQVPVTSAVAPPVKRENKGNQPPRAEPPNPSPAATSKGLKRGNSDDVIEVPNPNSQPQASMPQPARNGQVPVRNFPTPEQLNAMPPEKRKQFQEYVMRQNQRENQRQSQYKRFKDIESEEIDSFQSQTYPEVSVTAEQRSKMLTMTNTVKKVFTILDKWFLSTGNEERLRIFLRMSKRFEDQFLDKDMTQMKPSVTMKPDDTATMSNLMGVMINELVQRNPTLMKGKQPQNPPTAQLSATNLQQHQKQQQALSQQQQQQQAQKIQHQRQGNRNNVPAAPTTTHAPFQFGASAGSPQGNPVYSDKPPSTTRDNIQLPKNKKQKMESKVASASTSPQIPKPASPTSKRHNAAAPKVESPAKTFACHEQDCSASFLNPEELKKHNDEQHIRPSNPAQFSLNALCEFLDVPHRDINDLSTTENAQSAGTPALKMEMSSSAQGQTPNGRFDPGISSSMTRQTSVPIGKPKQAQTSPVEQSVSTPGTQNANRAIQDQQDDPWAAAGIDPNLLMNTFEPLTNRDMWRPNTPNDTPESSKDGISEPNSDISERVDLSITLDMFDNTWEAFPGGDVQYNMSNLNFDDDDVFMGESSGFANSEFSWDDIPVPSGPVPDLSSHYMLDTSRMR